jgi:transcriptional regulator with XRE-family HTH domain
MFTNTIALSAQLLFSLYGDFDRLQNNNNQKILTGVESIRKLQSSTLGDVLHECISKHGLVTLANELGIDKSALSRFKNGEGALTLEHIEKLLGYSDVVLIQNHRYHRLMSTIITLSEFLKESIGW